MMNDAPDSRLETLDHWIHHQDSICDEYSDLPIEATGNLPEDALRKKWCRNSTPRVLFGCP